MLILLLIIAFLQFLPFLIVLFRAAGRKHKPQPATMIEITLRRSPFALSMLVAVFLLPTLCVCRCPPPDPPPPPPRACGVKMCYPSPGEPLKRPADRAHVDFSQHVRPGTLLHDALNNPTAALHMQSHTHTPHTQTHTAEHDHDGTEHEHAQSAQPAAHTEPTDIGDIEALRAIYQSTWGQSWTRKDGWLQGDPCVDAWFGVSCSGGRVVSLNLTCNNLQNVLSPAISKLTAYVRLFRASCCRVVV